LSFRINTEKTPSTVALYEYSPRSTVFHKLTLLLSTQQPSNITDFTYESLGYNMVFGVFL